MIRKQSMNNKEFQMTDFEIDDSKHILETDRLTQVNKAKPMLTKDLLGFWLIGTIYLILSLSNSLSNSLSKRFNE
jgi:hypothetical protein